jgi:hemoglobin-like flavoprotein
MSTEERILVQESINELGGDIDQLSRIFYRELFHIDIHLKSVFSGDIVFLNRKFSNLMGTFKNVKHLEKISDSLEKMGERHIHHYGAQISHFPAIKQALMIALDQYFGECFTPELRTAWDHVFDEVASVMQQAMKQADRRKIQRLAADEANYDSELLVDIGGPEVVTRIHQRFYDVIFDEPWLGQFFSGRSKNQLIEKQTQFMVGAFGGPNSYGGDTPAFVHMHMYITDEMADLRENILRQAILDEGLDEQIAERWLRVDHAFRAGIVKKSIDECVMKCPGQMPLIARKL